MQKKKVVIAYDGEVEESVAIRTLVDAGYHVIAVCIDVGNRLDFTEIRTRAIQIGANSSYLINAQKEFAENYALLTVQSNAFCEHKYPFVSLLSRPLVAKKLVDIAENENAFAIVHGVHADNRQSKIHFDKLVYELNPSLKCMEWMENWTDEQVITYAEENNLPVNVEMETGKFTSESLWGREVLKDKADAVPKDLYKLTVPIEETPSEADWVELYFEKGIPVAINGEKMEFDELIVYLNDLAGKHGIGRVEPVDNYIVHQKTDMYYEFPAVITLLKAYGSIESKLLEKEVVHFKTIVSKKMVELIEEGLWFTPVREGLAAFVHETLKDVHGTVCIKLYKGQAIIEEKKPIYTKADSFEELAVVGFNG